MFNIKTFREFLLESPLRISSINGMNKSNMWLVLKDTSKLISIVLNKYKLYRHDDYLFLTDLEDNYLGNIIFKEFNELPKAVKILSSHSLVKGFYKTIFPFFPKDLGYNIILSDNYQSPEAEGSWKSILRNPKTAIIYNKTTKEIVDYDPDNHEEYYDSLNGGNYLVGIDLSKYKLSERFRDIQDRINLEIKGDWMYESKDDIDFMIDVLHPFNE